MYKLPENFDASFLIGCTLEMVCFNASQIYLHFDRSIMITIEGDFSYRNGVGQSVAVTDRAPIEHSDLMQLLEHKIVKASGNVNGTLTLEFDNGSVLQCIDSSPNYESYRIKYGERIFIV